MKPNPLTTTFDVIAFDADDTLWHNEPLFTQTKRKFEQLLKRYQSAEWINQKLDETEIRNIRHFGYGIKGFTLSMIETAIELTEGRVTGSEIMEVIGFAREMMECPVELLEGARETIEELSQTYDLMLITKGDLFDQESKIARSGLGGYFSRIEIVSEKDRRTYELIMRKHAITPERFLMVGNSIKSDVLPVIAAGGKAVYVHYPSTWFHEKLMDNNPEEVKFFQIDSIRHLPDFLNGYYMKIELAD
jgi:putative hydrolase of the HAD superfamily